MTANYPTKCWYVAATSDELSDAPLGRRLLDRDIVLWRTPDGKAVAFDDRCAHRGFPLSDGHVDGDRLVCGYHGCDIRGRPVCACADTAGCPDRDECAGVPDTGGAALHLDLARATRSCRHAVDRREHLG